MKRLVYASNIARPTEERAFDLDIPCECPHCQTALEPTHLASFFAGHDNGSIPTSGNLYSVYFCPKCEKCFMAQYRFLFYSGTGELGGSLIQLIPCSQSQSIFSDRICELSPRFVEIYHQSEEAEFCGLDEICGMGYRKALEFLVKDYAIFFNPDKEESIKNQMLSPCITTHIDNKRIKSLATASAWLGNDETHYVRKHEDYNLKHLKAFIASVVSFIDSDLAYLEAEMLLATSNKSKP